MAKHRITVAPGIHFIYLRFRRRLTTLTRCFRFAWERRPFWTLRASLAWIRGPSMAVFFLLKGIIAVAAFVLEEEISLVAPEAMAAWACPTSFPLPIVVTAAAPAVVVVGSTGCTKPASRGASSTSVPLAYRKRPFPARAAGCGGSGGRFLIPNFSLMMLSSMAKGSLNTFLTSTSSVTVFTRLPVVLSLTRKTEVLLTASSFFKGS
mmetsp:Transcript_3002/g.5759  ORF Transcript_3002/g.5759 Transcript_3002/m.5759 type:complete len:207 (-) Transcript_3002:520-1140(-)